MKAIRNSGLFQVITVLCLFLTSISWAVEFVTVLAIISVVLSAIALGWMIIDKINNAIKSREKQLSDLENALKKAKDQRDKNRDQSETLGNAISALEADVAMFGAAEDSASLAFKAAYDAFVAAQKNVRNKSDAFKAAAKAFDDHVKNCYYCQQMSSCSTADYLLYQKNAAWMDLVYAERRLGIAEGKYDDAADDWNDAWDDLHEARKKLGDLKDDLSDLEEAHSKLLPEIKNLEEVQIPAKQGELDDAKADLGTAGATRQEGPDYIDRLNKANDAGEDMEQWVKDNPPPDSAKKFAEIVSKYAD